MDIKQIQELVKLVNKTNIGEITIEEDGTKITIKQKKDPNQTIYTNAAAVAAPAVSQAVPAPAISKDKPPAAAQEPKQDNLITIKSPMIGTFYRQAGPGKPLFANVGDEVTPGKVVCIIEAKKLFNEIESEVSGKIVKILVENASS